jgi:hypothetical protein
LKTLTSNSVQIATEDGNDRQPDGVGAHGRGVEATNS